MLFFEQKTYRFANKIRGCIGMKCSFAAIGYGLSPWNAYFILD